MDNTRDTAMPFAVYVLGIGIFSMTTSEFMVSGMMPQLAEQFGVGIPAIGFLISAFAGAMSIGGPLITMGLLKVRPKQVLLVLLGSFLVGETIGALSDSYSTMMIARLITGATSSAFFGAALAVCATIVGPHQRGRASSIVLGGLMIGTVLGLPAATFISQSFGWRASFWSMTALALVTGLITAWTIPAVAKSEGIGLRGELTALANSRLWAALLTSMLIIGATFSAFSYFAPILTRVTGFPTSAVPWLLVVYGVATVVGNYVVGRLADRYTIQVLTTGLVSLIVVLTGFALLAQNRVATVVALIALGLVGVTMNPAMVTRVMRIANDRPLVNTVHTAIITLGVATGSSVGGIFIDAGYGLSSPLWIGAGLAALGLLTLIPDLVRLVPRKGGNPGQHGDTRGVEPAGRNPRTHASRMTSS